MRAGFAPRRRTKRLREWNHRFRMRETLPHLFIDELRAWLKNSEIVGYRVIPPGALGGYEVLIDRDKDAVLFKLTWAETIRGYRGRA